MVIGHLTGTLQHRCVARISRKTAQGQTETSTRRFGMSVLPSVTSGHTLIGCFAPEAALGRLEIQLPLYPESRLNSEIAACPKSASSGSRRP
jgi:hypothetical protein